MLLNLACWYNQKSKPFPDRGKIVKLGYVHDTWQKPFFRLHIWQLYLKLFAILFSKQAPG